MKKNKNHIEWEETPNKSEKNGSELIAEIVKHLPNKPGVYRMINKNGDVLYVGKAKNLKKRVTAYARGKGHGGNRTTKMIAETTDMEFITTHTETDSLILEANLIKRLHPKFNVLLRDDKSFPYIYISNKHPAPGIFKHRGAQSKNGKFYGPFASAGAVTTTINAIQKIFQIRTCSDSFYATRTRPCLQFQIKRCAAPCTGEIKSDEYQELVRQTQDFLEGKSEKIKKQYAKKMQDASELLDYETAAVYRDKLSAFSHVQANQRINPQNIKEADAFAVHEQSGLFCVQVFFFRTGQNWGNKAYFPRAHKTFKKDEVLAAFVSQFYDNKPIPKLILLSENISEKILIQNALSTKASRRIVVETPLRGKKLGIVKQVKQNAKEALERKIAETASNKKVLNGVAETFGLPSPPERIEVYDNSHISGENPVGAMIVANEDGFQKNQYRKFNIKSEINPGDDYAMMKEVLTRRFSKITKSQPMPDLVIIDGGKGQLSVAQKVMEELGHEKIMMVAIAKGKDRNAGRENFFQKNKKSFMLNSRDPVLYFMQRLRDEAHRFAIGSHRVRRKQQLKRNPLDEINGIGQRRKKALLLYFGSAKQTAKAGIEDLKKVEGISHQIAETIYNHFNET